MCIQVEAAEEEEQRMQAEAAEAAALVSERASVSRCVYTLLHVRYTCGIYVTCLTGTGAVCVYHGKRFWQAALGVQHIGTENKGCSSACAIM